MNIADIVIVALLVAAISLAVWLMRRSRAHGNCACCPYAKDCHKAKAKGTSWR